MYKLLLISLLAASHVNGSPAKATLRASFQNRIVGGQEAEPHAYPWQISLHYKDFIIGPYYHTCGATIIDELHIACAAHCIDGRKESHFQVIAGAHNIDLPEATKQKVGVEAMWMHEDYDSRVISNDVSVLRLDQPLEFNEYVQPLRLAETGNDPADGTVCINSGWGSTSHTTFPQNPSKLQYVEIPIVGRETCQKDYDGINGVDDGMICAGLDVGGISPCSGDSGGPLFCPAEDGEWYLAGIVSWGMIPCGQPNYPGVFTNVGYFRDWIDQHVAM